MGPIYKPSGAAAEYGDYALNIYTGCPHRCFYCYCPRVLHRDRKVFHSHVEPRRNIVAETRKQLERDETLRGKLIHLCFTCDPYPTGYDTSTTREVIKVLKEYGNNVQILTKGYGDRDFDLLCGDDWYGVTISCDMPRAYEAEHFAIAPSNRLHILEAAKCRGIHTWISFEPVLDPSAVLDCITKCARFIDKVKIGKLNYHLSDINWAKFGREAEELCKRIGLDCYIKDGLRAEMDKARTEETT